MNYFLNNNHVFLAIIAQGFLHWNYHYQHGIFFDNSEIKFDHSKGYTEFYNDLHGL